MVSERSKWIQFGDKNTKFFHTQLYADDEIKLWRLSGRMTHGVMTKMSLK